MRKPRAFTLLELLIVISILTLLLVILFPTYSYVRMMVKRTTCLYNIKQICLAIKNYGVRSGGKLPPDNWGYPPWGALAPTDPNKYLNPYLPGEGYKVLQCPSDQGGRTGSELSYFQTQGYSYWYACSDGQGISKIEGSVSWQENPIGELPSTGEMLENYLQQTNYYNGNGPENISDPCAKDSWGNYIRARDVTQAQIWTQNGPSDMWHTIVLPGLAAMAAQFQNNPNGVYLDPGGLWVPVTIGNAGSPSNIPGQPPNTKYVSEYNASNGMPASFPVANQGRWRCINPWGRTVYNMDYWRAPSKKVCVLDWDATFQFNTPGSNNTGTNDAVPKVGKGFWHAYQYIPDPLAPTDKGKYHVRCHAGFLDGHAAPIEMNLYYRDGNGNIVPISTPDRNNNPYY